MKWVKRILVAVTTLTLIFGALAGYGYWLGHQRPAFLPARILDADALAAAARSVEDKFAMLHGYALENTQIERMRVSGRPRVATDPTTAPAAEQTITLSADELNAFFSKWDKSLHWSDKYSRLISDPVLVLQDGRIIIAGKLTGYDPVFSIHIEPKLDLDGKLRLELARVMTGRMPLPRTLWDHYSDKLTGALENKAGQLRQRAQLHDDGTMNTDAVAVAMDELLAHAVRGEAAEPVLFLPQDLGGRLMRNALPVKVTAVAVKDNVLTMTVIPLSTEQRQALLKHIREGDPPPPGVAGTESGGSVLGSAE